ncbi:hypothetical protein PENTCL1PPCAC_12547, partial [Pristionchus entomophagus]
LSKLSSSVGMDREIGGRNRGYFNILGLPTELIKHIFSFLDMKDRLRARVNKRLDGIELDSKYHVDYLKIHHHHSPDFVRRIAQNASIGSLYIYLSGLNESNREIFNLIKEFDIDKLEFARIGYEILKEMMVDSFLSDLTRSCKSMHMWACRSVTSDGLYQVYKTIKDRSAKLRILFVNDIIDEPAFAFLKHIGITFRDGTFYSNRNIEVYQRIMDNGSVVFTRIFEGYLEIFLDHFVFMYGWGNFKLILHETRESLEEAKNPEYFDRVEVSPE